MGSIRTLAVVLAVAVAAGSSTRTSADPAPGAPSAPATERRRVADLAFLGMVTFPSGHAHEGTRFGGISGLAYDAATARYLAICDDRSQHAPARFYTLTIDASDGRLDAGDVAIVGVTTLRDAAGTAFPTMSLDPEGIVLAPGGATVWVSSEGDAHLGIAPWLREFRIADGKQVNSLLVALRYFPAEATGIRHNLAFESLTLVPGVRRLVTATENALKQDGPEATKAAGSSSRVLVYDLESRAAVREVVYRVEPVPPDPAPDAPYLTNGLVEMLALDGAGTFLALERAFRPKGGNDARLYEVSIEGARDVLAVDALAPGGVPVDVAPTATKRELLRVASVGVVPDNLEALALGPSLPGGRRLLIVASDDNFSASQVTQFLAFSLKLE